MAEQVVRLLNMPAVINQHLDGQLEARETVIDLLTELLHFAGQTDVDFEAALGMARWNYREEPDQVYELQIHDQEGPDLSFEFGTREEAEAFLNEEYPPARGLDWVLIDPSGNVVDGTR